MSYQVIIPKPVQKQLDDLPDDIFKRTIEKLDGLKENQFLKKVDELLTLLFLDKYHLVLTDYTEDLVEYSLASIDDWDVKESGWDHV